MQACHASIPALKKYTMVMSVKNIWFLELKVEVNQAKILISDPVAVGSPGSNLKLLHFLDKAKSEGAMTLEDQKKWQEALSVSESQRRGTDLPRDGRPGSHKKIKTGKMGGGDIWNRRNAQGRKSQAS